MRRRFFSFIAVVLSAAQLVWGLPLQNLYAYDKTTTDVSSLTAIPKETRALNIEKGEINYSFEAKKKDAPLLILIEDAHASLDAQESIRAILRGVKAKYPQSKIFVEGTEGAVRWEVFWRFPAEESRKIVSQYFLRKGRMSGAEVYAASETDGEILYGIEDKKAYQANVEAYLKGQKVKAEGETGLKQLQKGLNRLKGRYYTNELRSWERENLIFENSPSAGLIRYLKFLSNWAEKEKVPLENYPHIQEVLRLETSEAKAALGKLESQSQNFALALFDEKDKLEKKLFKITPGSKVTKSILISQIKLNLLRQLFCWS